MGSGSSEKEEFIVGILPSVRKIIAFLVLNFDITLKLIETLS